jgi:hypothetical protein
MVSFTLPDYFSFRPLAAKFNHYDIADTQFMKLDHMTMF